MPSPWIRSRSRPPRRGRRTLSARIELLVVALTLLVFLVAIGRPGWFELRPASGASQALYHGAGPADGGTPS